MDKSPVADRGEQPVFGRLLSPGDRRNFLKWSGTAAATALLAACDKPFESPGNAALSETGALAEGSDGRVTINLSRDLGILNFAYALEQLEAAFYTKVIDNFYQGVSDEEEAILRDLKRHEVVHREFFRVALGSARIPELSVDFSSIDFNSRESVLGTAKVFEDTGVGAYNGAAQFLRNSDYLVVAGKIVSVEARHASAIRDVFGRSFAPDAFDPAFTFERVLRLVDPFIATRIAITHSPTAGQADRASTEEMVS
jgi:hypothetical protein